MKRSDTVRGALAALIACAFAAANTPAMAHSYLRSSTPAGGSTSETPPTEVTIVFTEALEPKLSRVEVKDTAGHDVTAGPAHPVGDGATTLTAPLRPLQPGHYTVTWHVTSTDTHKTHGGFAFDVAKPDE